MTKHDYTGYTKVAVTINHAVGFLALTLGLVLMIGLPASAVGTAAALDTVICLAIWILLILGSVGLSLLNSSPTVWVSDDHMEISAFLFARVRVEWKDIVDIGAGRVPFGFVLVRARRITPFHRLYGWLYSRTFVPAFLIGPEIKQREELIEVIKRNSRTSGPA